MKEHNPNVSFYDALSETTKKYYLLKNNYYEEIIDFQDTLAIPIDLFSLIEEQHKLLKEYDKVLKVFEEEISYRKILMKNFNRVLTELNQKVINKLIDKVYIQEQEIERLTQDIYQLRIQMKYKGKPTINVITPRNNNEFTGTIAFFKNGIKNINQFINIKKVNVDKPKNTSTSISMCAYNNRSNSTNKKHNRNVSKSPVNADRSIKHIRSSSINMNPKLMNTNYLESKRLNSVENTVSKRNRIDNTNSNSIMLNTFTNYLSINSKFLQSSSPQRLQTENHLANYTMENLKSKPTRVTRELLGKSFQVVQNYQGK